MFWAHLGITLGLMAIQYLLRPRGPQDEASKSQRFAGPDQNQARRAHPIPLIFGRVRIDSGTLLWYGAKKVTPLNEDGDTPDNWATFALGWDSSDAEVISFEGARAFEYRLTWVLGLGIPSGPSSTPSYLRRVWIDDRCVWSGRLAAGAFPLGGTEFTFTGADVNTGTEEITLHNHGLVTGSGPAFVRSDGTLPTGLSASTSYWVIRTDDDKLKLATSRANALANSPVNLTTTGSLPSEGAHYLSCREQFLFVPGDVNTGTGAITITSHGLLTGHGPVRVGSTGTAPSRAPLGVSPISGFDLYVIKVDNNTIKLALSFGQALSGNNITLNYAGSGTHRLYAQPEVSNFYGGPLKGGRLGGAIWFLPGTRDQVPCPALVAAYNFEESFFGVYDGAETPAYRDQAYLVLGASGNVLSGTGSAVVFSNALKGGFSVGENPSLPQVSVELECTPNGLGVGALGSNGQANPVECIYKLWTDAWVGLGRATAGVDTTTWAAAATQVATEGNGLSMLVSSASNAENVIAEICAQIEGFPRYNPKTDKIEFVLIRDDYVVANLPLFNPDNVRSVDFAFGTWAETYNEVRLTFPDQAMDHQENVAIAQAWALQAAAHDGAPRAHTINMPGVRDADVAHRIAQRVLRTMARPRREVTLFCNRDAAFKADGNPLLSGDVIKLTWPDDNITEMVVRVGEVDRGQLDDGEVTVRGVVDKFSEVLVGGTGMVSVSPPGVISPGEAAAITTYAVEEVPRWISRKAEPLELDEVVSVEPTAMGRLLYLAKDPGTTTSAILPKASANAGITFFFDKKPMPLCAYGQLAQSLLRVQEPYETSSPTVVENITMANGAPVTSVIKALFDPSNQIRSQGINLVQVGTGLTAEIIAFETYTDAGSGDWWLEDVWRGMLDTVPREHPAGTQVWFYESVKLAAVGSLTFDPTSSLVVKLIPTGFSGPMPEDEVTLINVTLNRRDIRPYPPGRFRLRQTVEVNAGSDTNDLTDTAAHSAVLFG